MTTIRSGPPTLASHRELNISCTAHLQPEGVQQTYFLPSFLPPLQGLVGEKYGSIRVPGEVDSAEFEMILDAAVEAGMDTHILEEWYCRDENSVPPAYYLKPKAQMLKNYQNSVSPHGFYKRLPNHNFPLTPLLSAGSGPG